jgi:hypothetical protein
MDDTTINYVIYIATTPKNLWDTLTNRAEEKLGQSNPYWRTHGGAV